MEGEGGLKSHIENAGEEGIGRRRVEWGAGIEIAEGKRRGGEDGERRADGGEGIESAD